ncbi:hypothetical protein DFH06DRAFT_1051695 [Mycena polygramma]|nr:hypothetical protein DFH06DRAFT_1051695 [Mycena polygramma]
MDCTAADQKVSALSEARTDLFLGELRACFGDLARTNEAQMDKLRTVVEGLRMTPPVVDKKTAFWDAYNMAADEYDKEYQQTYSTDLDASLIFAGLFSAVSSAFIIQIQPEVHAHGTPSLVVIAQCLLYASLSLTLLTALLAVLGKQWLMYYSAAGERGTIEARGLERQRKFDGLHRWKFDALLQTFPLLLQFALLLFSAALSTYLWTVHHALATTVLFFTVVGFGSYSTLLLSAAISPDSPFRIPLAPVVARIISTVTRMVQILRRYRAVVGGVCSSTGRSSTRRKLPRVFNLPTPLSNVQQTARPLPIFDTMALQPSPAVTAVSWMLETLTDPNMVTLAAQMAVDLQWPSAGNFGQQIIRLRDAFASCFLYDTLADGRILLWDLRPGMSGRAAHIGRAYFTLLSASRTDDFEAQPIFAWDWSAAAQVLSPELTNVLRIVVGTPDLLLDAQLPQATKWCLHVIPFLNSDSAEKRSDFLQQFLKKSETAMALDVLSFTDYLFCLYAFLTKHVSHHDAIWVDKSAFQEKLFLHLFMALESAVTKHLIPMDLAVQIIRTTNQLQSTGGPKWVVPAFQRQLILYDFCDRLPRGDRWLDLVLACGLLVQDHRQLKRYPGFIARYSVQVHRTAPIGAADFASWVYTALFRLPPDDGPWDNETIAGVAHLLLALIFYKAPLRTDGHIGVAVRALLSPGDIATIAGFLLLHQRDSDPWNHTETTCTLLTKPVVWTAITKVVIQQNDPMLDREYVRMASEFSLDTRHWRSNMWTQLRSWMLDFIPSRPQQRLGCDSAIPDYNKSLEEWHILTDFSDDSVFALLRKNMTLMGLEEIAHALSCSALSKAWEELDFASPDNVGSLLLWLYCTIGITLRHTYIHHLYRIVDDNFKTTFYIPLKNSLLNAAVVIQQPADSSSDKDALSQRADAMGSLANIMERLAEEILKSTTPKRDWEARQTAFKREIDQVAESLNLILGVSLE